VLVCWAAIEAAQCAGKNIRTGRRRDQIAQRRGRNIGVTAAVRDLIQLVYYALRDGHVRCLDAIATDLSPIERTARRQTHGLPSRRIPGAILGRMAVRWLLQ
jgi:hypothetical protein